MPSFLNLIQPLTKEGLRTSIIAFAQAAKLSITNWSEVGVGAQFFEVTLETGYLVSSLIAKAVRGYASLDTSVDPGDDDPYDANNASLPAQPGYLTSFLKNTFGIDRVEADFATGSVVFRNDSNSAKTIAPGSQVFTWQPTTPPGRLSVTYRNADDASVYTNPDGSLTIEAGRQATLPVVCDIIGEDGTCPSGSLSLTTTAVGCSATNPGPIIGHKRQDAASARNEARAAKSRLSLSGPSSAYEYFAKRKLDGTMLYNAATPPAPIGITRVYVSQDSSTGIVVAWYATESGAAIANDVTAANRNISEQVFGVPDAITFDGYAAIETSITVVGSCEIEFVPGLDVTAIANAIVVKLAAAFQTFQIGGLDRVDGAGKIYRSDLEAIARSAYPGLYKVRITTPSAESTAIAAGHVATLQSAATDWTVNVVMPS